MHSGSCSQHPEFSVTCLFQHRTVQGLSGSGQPKPLLRIRSALSDSYPSAYGTWKLIRHNPSAPRCPCSPMLSTLNQQQTAFAFSRSIECLYADTSGRLLLAAHFLDHLVLLLLSCIRPFPCLLLPSSLLAFALIIEGSTECSGGGV